MPTNEAGLSGGQDEGDGGRTTASDMPGGERNDGPTSSGIGQDQRSAGQVASGGFGEGIADQTGGGRAGLVPDEATRGQQPSGGSGAADTDMTDGGHLGRGGDPVEGRTDPAATGQGPGD